ncbi:IS3 family transposase [Erwinia sp. AnSW2-5]|uniref:IS3 family transposase n=1 Tax=Erwinia sp. AnSW2-5 TaxID=3367692 RepID=UPI00385CF955
MLSLREEHALPDLLRAAQLAKSTLYYRRARQEVADKYAQVKGLITAFFHQHNGCYGYRRIHCLIRKAGWSLSPKTVRRLMLELRLKSPVRQKKYRSYRGNAGTAAENVLQRDFKAAAPCEKWVTDVTEFNVAGQKLYLSPVLDLFNGEIVAWATSRRPEMELVSRMLKRAFSRLVSNPALVPHTF